MHLSDETFLCLLINNKKIVSKISVDMVKFAPNAYLILMVVIIKLNMLEFTDSEKTFSQF